MCNPKGFYNCLFDVLKAKFDMSELNSSKVDRFYLDKLIAEPIAGIEVITYGNLPKVDLIG